jgi:hypothetical protein
VRWHRAGFRCYWRWESLRSGGRLRIATEWPTGASKIRSGAHHASTAKCSSLCLTGAAQPGMANLLT